MNLSQTFKATVLSGALLAAQQGCAYTEGDNCSIEAMEPSKVVMNNSGEVAQFCRLYRDAVITCVQTARGCPISQTVTSPCSDYQSNSIIQDAEVIAQHGGDFFVTCVEGTGMMVNGQ